MRPGYFIQSGVDGSDFETIKKFLKNVLPGSILVSRKNFTNSSELSELIKKINKFYRIENGIEEPYYAIDQEGGNVIRLSDVNYIPSNLALGKINNIQFTYYSGLKTGFDLASVGINWNLAPDLDVLKNFSNPVILERSFGTDIDSVSKHGIAYINGLRKYGVASTAKHFPGHGFVSADSHKILPVDGRNISEIYNDMEPFVKSSKNNVDSIMMSHVEYENIDPYPASLSEKLYDILRNKIGFKGVIITDSMDMKAISLNYSYREIVNLSLNNGADIVESADTGTAENLKYELEKIEIKDENNKIKRIKNLIPERILNFKPPDKIMDVISYKSIVWKRYVTLEPEKDFYLIFMPYSLTDVNSDMNNYSKLKEELELNNFKFKFIQFRDLKDVLFTRQQLIFLGRNENFYDNYKIINEKAKGNRCVYISTSLGMDDGLINDDIGYICTYSTKVENIIYAIYSILGFV